MNWRGAPWRPGDWGIVRSGVILAAVAVSASAGAGEWPQILGPSRNGIAVDESIMESLPPEGPKTLWKHDVGEGFAGVAVAGQRVVLFHRRGTDEIAEALSPRTGAQIWKRSFPATYSGGYSPDAGPRCVPVIHRDRVFLFGAASDLHCVALEDGRSIWSRSLRKDFSIPESFFGAGSTPIVEGDRLLLNVGGRSGAGIVAFSVGDGKTIWQKTNEQASYSSPIAVTEDGVRQVIFVTRLSALSIDPADGRVRWSFPFGDRGPTVNAANPLAFNGHLFVTASYGIGAVCAKFGKDSVRQLWANNDTMSSQYSTCVRHGGYLYGIDGRQDVGATRLRCIDPLTGNVRWTNDRFGMATLILADGKLLIVRDDGTLVLAVPSPDEYRELGRAKILNTTTRALPALADGLLYVRDTSVLKCVDLRRSP